MSTRSPTSTFRDLPALTRTYRTASPPESKVQGPRSIRIGNMQAKGYLEEDFEEAFQRYMSASDRGR